MSHSTKQGNIEIDQKKKKCIFVESHPNSEYPAEYMRKRNQKKSNQQKLKQAFKKRRQQKRRKKLQRKIFSPASWIMVTKKSLFFQSPSFNKISQRQSKFLFL